MPSTDRKLGEEAVARLNPDDLRRFVDGFHGDVVLPPDDGYDEARRVWNGMVEKYPAIVARCAGTADAVAAVEFAREHDLLLAVRGGGHSVAGAAVCDGGLVVDLSAMNGVHVDPEAGRVRAGGGATIGDVDRETQLFGLAAPLGVVSATGIAGLTLNGGVGHLRRKHGLSLDGLVSVQVVTADGSVRTASASENTDLFWALRGGGGSVGVVTSFEYRLHEVGPEVVGLFVWHHGDDAVAALRAFREWADGASRDASVVAFTAFVPDTEEFPDAAWGDPAVVFLGCHVGATADAESAFRPLREVTDPVADHGGPTAYTALQSLLDADYPDGRRYYWKATYVEELTDDVVDLVVRRGVESPSPLSTVDVWHLGGAIADVAPSETAFAHREPSYMVTFEANWDDPGDDDANVAWGQEGIEALRELDVAAGTYGNFPGFGEDPTRSQFGDNYDRLVEVKTRYDPGNLFRLGAGVEPRASSRR